MAIVTKASPKEFGFGIKDSFPVDLEAVEKIYGIDSHGHSYRITTSFDIQDNKDVIKELLLAHNKWMNCISEVIEREIEMTRGFHSPSEKEKLSMEHTLAKKKYTDALKEFVNIRLLYGAEVTCY